ncbi:hypothetical protein SDC9_166552 [bioreactor metagenome]|uniref:Uncharacterized protein n=1 Tax=bioreactor metagenome TaxID=1076179 RepID=A0A645FZ40_9ZZZZ|nr:hypothetical protein [Oscillospiraceae bacterium]
MKKAVILYGKVVGIYEYGEQGIQLIGLPNEAILYDCSNLDVKINDDFVDGNFTREGVPVAIIQPAE